MAHVVQVSNIAATTTKEQLQSFFAFCGKISDITVTEGGEKKTASVSFEKPTAAKTALMLNGGTLDGSNITVTSETEHVDAPAETSGDHSIEQTDKPRAAIAAEYLAHGYGISDQILERAIAIDQQQGISTKFLSYLKSFDSGVGQRALGPDQTISGKILETAKSLDETHGLTTKANDYYTQALQSPFGQRVFSFYTTTSKQVLDIHEEARRIADAKKADTAKATPAETSTTPAAAPVDEKETA